MKSAAIKRGLFVKRKLSSEDCWSLNEYLESQKELSADILRDNGIDPDSLFDIVAVDKKLTAQERKALQDHGKEPPESRERECIKWTTFDRDSLSTEVDQALEVFLLCTGAHRNLQSPERHDAFCDGIRLATAVEHMNANLAWRKSVAAGEGTHDGGVKGAEAKYGEIGARAKARVVAYRLRRADYPTETKKKSKIAVAEQCEPTVNYKRIEADLRAVARIKKER